MQPSETVIIKGVREGLLFILDDDVPYAQLLTELAERISARPNFFRGSGVIVNLGRRIIETPDFDVLYRMLNRNEMSVITVVSMSAQTRMVAESVGVASRPPNFASGDAGVSLGLQGRGTQKVLLEAASGGGVSEVGTGLFLRTSLRHGQAVRYPGDVCVLGDVEPGAEVVADGDIVVWGILRGIAHAGASGDDEAVVCALQMSPSQIGIAALVTRFPQVSGQSPRPRLARVEEGRVVIEAWIGEESATGKA